jgi:hypothetical protein
MYLKRGSSSEDLDIAKQKLLCKLCIFYLALLLLLPLQQINHDSKPKLLSYQIQNCMLYHIHFKGIFLQDLYLLNYLNLLLLLLKSKFYFYYQFFPPIEYFKLVLKTSTLRPNTCCKDDLK